MMSIACRQSNCGAPVAYSARAGRVDCPRRRPLRRRFQDRATPREVSDHRWWNLVRCRPPYPRRPRRGRAHDATVAFLTSGCAAGFGWKPVARLQKVTQQGSPRGGGSGTVASCAIPYERPGVVEPAALSVGALVLALCEATSCAVGSATALTSCNRSEERR